MISDICKSCNGTGYIHRRLCEYSNSLYCPECGEGRKYSEYCGCNCTNYKQDFKYPSYELVCDECSGSGKVYWIDKLFRKNK